jgi:hypothetical protein
LSRIWLRSSLDLTGEIMDPVAAVSVGGATRDRRAMTGGATWVAIWSFTTRSAAEKMSNTSATLSVE